MIKPLVELAVETGMRQGELLRLQWSDIDWVSRTLAIPETKNGESRTVPLTASAQRFLEQLQSPLSAVGLDDFEATRGELFGHQAT